MKHKCHALGCETAVHPRFLMCPKHWRKVPKKLQNDVWRFYVPGQEIKKNPTLDYLSAAWTAIFAVADLEGIPYDAKAIMRQVAIKFAATKTDAELDAIAIEHLLSTVQAFVSPELPITDSERVDAIQKLITPEVLSALGRLHMELDNIKQAQERNFPGISGTHKNCPVCKRPIPKKRKYCSIKCSNMAQARKSAEVRQKGGETWQEHSY